MATAAWVWASNLSVTYSVTYATRPIRGDRFNLGVAFGHLDTDADIIRACSRNGKVRSWHAGGYVGAEFGAARKPIELGGEISKVDFETAKRR